MSSKKLYRSGKTPLAVYANYFEAGHNQCEFLIDFGQFRPEDEDVVLHTRIVLGPLHAKLLTEMLHAAVQQYETQHGAISIPSDVNDPMEMILRSLPDFETRAVETRRKAAEALASSAKSRTHSKR